MSQGYLPDSLSKLVSLEEYKCTVLKYGAGQSQLHIRAENLSGDTYYLFFLGVRYFSGPMEWQGVNIQLGTSTECLDILRQIERFRGLRDEELTKTYRFFILGKYPPSVKIVAAGGELFNELN